MFRARPLIARLASLTLARPASLTLASLVLMAMVAPLQALAATPAQKTTTIWGNTGLVVMPTAHVLGFRDYRLGATVMTKGPGLQVPAAVPFATAGVFDGLEFGVLYGVPVAGFTGLAGHAKYQLVRPTRERPTAVAVGVSLLGVPSSDRYVDGNNLYLVLSHDLNATWNGATYTLVSGHFGFSGNLNLGARMMAGAEVPLGERGHLQFDFLGPAGLTGGFFSAGGAFDLTPEWQLRAYTMGVPGAPVTERELALGLSYAGNFLGDGGPAPTPRPTPRPAATPAPTARPTPPPVPLPSVPPPPSPLPSPAGPVTAASPAPSPAPVPSAPPSPTAAGAEPLLTGTLLDDKGRTLVGWSVGVAALDRWAVTDVHGRYEVPLPLGPHDVAVRDPQGRQALSKPVRLVKPAGMALPLVVAVPTGQLKGAVIDKTTRQGLGDVRLQLFRPGETYNLGTRGDGAFFQGDLPAGRYRVVATRSRYQPFEGTVEIAPRQEKSLIVALTPRPGALAGRVTSLQGQGQPGVSVAIPGLKLTVATDRLGAYQFKELPPGAHEVVFSQGSRRVATTLVRVRSDETTTENVTMRAETPPVGRGGTVGGQITDAATRRPLAGVKIVVEGGDLTVLTLTATDGRFTVSDLPAGRYKLTATKAGYKPGQGTTQVTATAGGSLNLQLTPGS